MLEETSCDAVMIGRGVLGNPWLIKEIVDYLETGTEPTKVSEIEKLNMIKHHFDLLLDTKSEKLALLEIRSHAAWYLKGINNTSELKNEIFKTTKKEEFINLIDNYIKEKTNEI